MLKSFYLVPTKLLDKPEHTHFLHGIIRQYINNNSLKNQEVALDGPYGVNPTYAREYNQFVDPQNVPALVLPATPPQNVGTLRQDESPQSVGLPPTPAHPVLRQNLSPNAALDDMEQTLRDLTLSAPRNRGGPVNANRGSATRALSLADQTMVTQGSPSASARQGSARRALWSPDA